MKVKNSRNPGGDYICPSLTLALSGQGIVLRIMKNGEADPFGSPRIKDIGVEMRVSSKG